MSGSGGSISRCIRAVVGLGNPGRKYAGTRHNVGFEVLDLLAKRHGVSFKRSWRLGSFLCTMPICDQELLLVKPQGYMNRSGDAAAGLKRRRGVAPEEMLIVVDDVDLPLGRIRLRPRGGAGGHNGLRSIFAGLGSEEFSRLRIGVGGRSREDGLVGHVLGRFDPAEQDIMREVIPRAADAVLLAVEEGVAAAMNQVNTRGANGAGNGSQKR